MGGTRRRITIKALESRLKNVQISEDPKQENRIENSRPTKEAQNQIEQPKSGGGEGESSISNLPSDIFLDILLRLPIKTLKPCIWVCKSWYHTMHSPLFASLHLKKAYQRTSLLIRGYDEPYVNHPQHTTLSTTNSTQPTPTESSTTNSTPTESSWLQQPISSILKAHSLIGYIDGTYPCPNKFVQDERGAATAQINPEYQIWNTQDQALMTLLNATLSQTALSHVIGYSTSREAWLALERRFSASTRSNILQLKSALHNISKGKDSIDSYIQKIKQARDSLASVSVLIEDEDILIYVLNGLPQEYNAFKTSIRTKSENITLEEVYAMLKIEEQTIESVHK
ncbi:hypothetical protein F0562_010018 [Nyssa sinensis]|uniref:F-box domain-containing protein n=1 Tax=Nyssa sinensis TaxID=561372 RepID=A0A5J4ZXQ2_9ASTE|nr:hypothetical protein F0562_010018 [Nyssa sinensis]